MYYSHLMSFIHCFYYNKTCKHKFKKKHITKEIYNFNSSKFDQLIIKKCLNYKKLTLSLLFFITINFQREIRYILFTSIHNVCDLKRISFSNFFPFVFHTFFCFLITWTTRNLCSNYLVKFIFIRFGVPMFTKKYESSR